MRTSTLTIRLDRNLDRLLDQVSRQTGQTRSEIAREALRRHVALRRFEELRRRVLPFAEARGYLTDEDVLSDLS
jgi:predicted transcriptional regulator